MKKARFLKIEPLELTEEMIQEALDEKWYMFLRARILEDNILNVSVFMRKSICKGSTHPDFEIFVDKENKEWTSRDVRNGSWRTAKINRLADYSYGSGYGRKNWNIPEERTLVNKYFGTGKNLEIKTAVREFQSDIREENLWRRWINELEQIDETMNEVPELPEDFTEWALDVGFKKNEYILYDRKEDKYYCTHCRKMVRKPETTIAHNEGGWCPECVTDITFKAWKKQKTLVDEKRVGILQRLNDNSGYILRKFGIKRTLRRENQWKVTRERSEVSKIEERRSRLGQYMEERELFEWGEYKYTGQMRWCHQCRRSPFRGWANHEYGKAIMYTKNLQEELQGEKFAHADIALYLGGEAGMPVEPVKQLKRLHQHPFIEYLEKMGLKNLCADIMRGMDDGRMFDSIGRNVKEILKIDKQRINRLIQMNGDMRILKALQVENRLNIRLADAQIYYTAGNIEQFAELAEKTGLSLIRLINYIQRQQDTGDFGTMQETLRMYEDYINMAELRGMDIRDEIVCRNTRMREYHDRYVEEDLENKKKNRDMAVDIKFGNIKKCFKENHEHFTWEDETYIIRVPKKASDITKEGRVQHHCVGASDTYLSRMAEKKTFILFLRKKKSPGKAYYTLETEWNGKIIQAYAAYDRKPDWETVEKVLNTWSEDMKKRTEKEKAKEKMQKAAG